MAGPANNELNGHIVANAMESTSHDDQPPARDLVDGYINMLKNSYDERPKPRAVGAIFSKALSRQSD